ncbi:hypothetical protein KUV62_01270 [Salipiger bermudensis]|uniref:hypothetical protein n=1 Tax=Salipiger bermudensis TaxID=344736 RepID=UPI001C99DD70|nr:hypothetical protein [Salipiger bermudensis]MBY6002518.1 hypothetical protein [Salipiger bermudensis]
MKRLLTATALAATMATSAFAASDAEEAAITMYYPDANFSVLSDDQVTEMFAVANSGKSDTEKRTEIEAIAAMDNPSPASADVSDMDLTAYVPEWRLNEMTDAEKREVVALVNKDENPDNVRIQLLKDMESAAPNLTTGEMQAVKDIVPSADLTVLTTEQVNKIRAAIYGSDEDTEKRSVIEDALS